MSSYKFNGLPILAFFLMSSLLLPGYLTAQKNKKQTQQSKPVEIILTDNEMSPYRIVIPSAATEYERKAADVLQKYLLEISGTALPIVPADVHRSKYEILLGQNERLDELQLNINLNALKEDGFLIKTDSLRLIIAGGNEKGTLYGVYSFLETYLGCRMYSSNVKVIPKQKKLVLKTIHDEQIPVITFRDVFYRDTWQDEYTDWHKLDHDSDGERIGWGMWVHTFNALVPPEMYYEEHSEYFSLVDGKRIPTQLCLTNSDVLQITIQNLRKKIAQNPSALYWSVSQNDNKSYCTCDKCKAIDEREGSPAGSIIHFVNQVADQFPDKIISTLAYEYGRRAPRTLKPRDNVNIMLCSIEAFRHRAIAEDPESADFVRDVKEWGKIAKDIIVWDYVIQFNNLISPFPNLHVLQPNVKFFADHGVNAMFEQGNKEVGGEFAALRAYMLSKFLWNPNENPDSVMNDFLNGYYGAAGPLIKQYIDKMRDALTASNQPLRIFGTPIDAASGYLSPRLISEYEKIFDEAEKAVADRSELLERVRIARQPLEFAMLEQAKKNFADPGGVFEKVDGNWQVRTSIREKIDPFTDLCIREGVTQIKEWSTSPEEYRSAMYRMFSQGMREHLAMGKKPVFISPTVDRIPADEDPTILTDGKRGSHDYDYNWFSFPGQDLEVIIDLDAVKTVRRIESAYYQYAFWLRILPKKVEYFTSKDGKEFELVRTVVNTLPIDQYGGQQRDFIAEFEPRPARFIKVKAHTIGNTPGWHPGAGRPANILVDEIVVE